MMVADFAPLPAPAFSSTGHDGRGGERAGGIGSQTIPRQT